MLNHHIIIVWLELLAVLKFGRIVFITVIVTRFEKIRHTLQTLGDYINSDSSSVKIIGTLSSVLVEKFITEDLLSFRGSTVLSKYLRSNCHTCSLDFVISVSKNLLSLLSMEARCNFQGEINLSLQAPRYTCLYSCHAQSPN